MHQRGVSVGDLLLDIVGSCVDMQGNTVIDRNLFFGAVLETKDREYTLKPSSTTTVSIGVDPGACVSDGPFNSWDRLPFVTSVRNGTPSMIPAQNYLTRNFFFSGSPFAIDTDGKIWHSVCRSPM